MSTTHEEFNVELQDPTASGGVREIAWPLDHPRAVNDVLALMDSTWLSERTFARPTHYDIAVSVVCNIKCPFCPRQTFGPEIKSGFMKEEHFTPVAPHLQVSQRTGLYGLGEPFLNKKFFDFLAAAKAQGSYCMTSSHGMSLTSERIDQILDSGLDELCVSMDGANARTFGFLRNGADFDTVVANVTELLRRRNERKASRPRVHIACAISKYNVWQLTAMVKLAKRMGADKLAFSNLVLDFEEHAHASIVGTRVFRFNLDRAMKAAKRVGLECVYFFQMPFPNEAKVAPVPRPNTRYGCPSAWRQIIVERDGNLKPCCYLDVSLGNSMAAPMTEQFNSASAVALRRSFTKGEYGEKCRGCGQFMEISDEETRRILAEARDKIEKGNFSDAVRAQLRHVLEHYEELFRESCGVAAAITRTA